jgi:hypothetical protein
MNVLPAHFAIPPLAPEQGVFAAPASGSTSASNAASANKRMGLMLIFLRPRAASRSGVYSEKKKTAIYRGGL